MESVTGLFSIQPDFYLLLANAIRSVTNIPPVPTKSSKLPEVNFYSCVKITDIVLQQCFLYLCPVDLFKLRVSWKWVTGKQVSIYIPSGLTLSQMTFFRLFQPEEFADNNRKFTENGRKFAKLVENTVGKGEISHYEQFLLSPKCFKKA